ncbi:hypothetical protein [Gordonia soli]|uniref:Uncharacterized protein n=1 Tax=Gordonia soli NBRC 108243 TaxID=1223545 RepID=M0QHB3_9ACTN|nr:hypothetical protein [Gordonia soli]GAC67706.1 hypothetical protein GS4_09_00200 [Gordonia soli NBRC 108243]
MTRPEDPERQPLGDLYRRPLSGGLYPPLGHGPDGTPLFVPGQPLRSERPPTPPPSDDGAGPETVDSPDRARRPFAGLAVAVVLLVVAVLVAVAGASWLRPDPTPDDSALPTITELPEVPTYPTAPRTRTPDTDQPGARQPGLVPPGGTDDPTAPRIDATGKSIVYETTVSGTATLLYIDDGGLQTVISAPPTWTIAFTGSTMPLRLLVIAGDGTASCTIKVDGKVVVTDRVGETTAARTASCTA